MGHKPATCWKSLDCEASVLSQMYPNVDGEVDEE